MLLLTVSLSLYYFDKMYGETRCTTLYVINYSLMKIQLIFLIGHGHIFHAYHANGDSKFHSLSHSCTKT